MMAFAAVLFAGLAVQPCQLDGIKAECGTVQVPENRAQPAGRQIGIHVAVIRAKPPARSHDAIFVLAGGPGQAAGDLADYAAPILGASGRDMVFADMRGTGQSHGLHCDLGGSPRDIQGYFNDFLPIDRILVCKKKLEKSADLTQYTTRAAADDTEAVRNALGYGRIDLYGTSYGTRLAQEFMRHYPDSVRVAILDGVVSPSLASPAGHAPDGQRSLDGVFALCKADSACRAAYPHLDADYQAMLRRIARGIAVRTRDPKTKRDVVFKISRGLFGEVFRNFLYSPDEFARVPYVVHRAAQGDFAEFGQMALLYAPGIRTLDDGLFLSVTCTADFPRIDLAAAEKAAQGTLFGPYRLEQQAAACAIWPRGKADPERTSPVRGSIPTLLISGELDPVTPPKYAREVASALSHAKHVVVPNGSHGGGAGACVRKIVLSAIEAGSVDRLDTACVARIPPPKFFRESTG